MVAFSDAFGELKPFTLLHGGVVLAMLAVTVAAIIVRRKLHNNPQAARRFDVALGSLGMVAWVIINGWWLLPEHFDPQVSWPLHLCDLIALIAPLALLTNFRGLRAILYFWGLGLNTQGLITPLEHAGPAHVQFWIFWISHTLAVGGALYDLFGRGFRPTWRDFRTALFASGAYLVIVLAIDLTFGVNYGYIGPTKPDAPTLIDSLGPWPWRVGVIVVLACVVMTLLMLP